MTAFSDEEHLRRELWERYNRLAPAGNDFPLGKPAWADAGSMVVVAALFAVAEVIVLSLEEIHEKLEELTGEGA